MHNNQSYESREGDSDMSHNNNLKKNTTVEAILKFILKIDTPNTYTYPLTFLA